MRERTIRGHDLIGQPHPIHHHPRHHGHEATPADRADTLLALSIEGPGRRSMRGLDGRRGRPGAGPVRHERHDEHVHAGSRRGFLHQVRRGAVREAVLRTLADEPMHGYQLMLTFSEQTGGRWRPSAGSIYPTLQQLEDEGLVEAQELDGRRVFALTDSGRAAVAALPEGQPWPGRQDGGGDLRGLSRELGIAAMQVTRMGTPAAIDAATAILVAARRDLYRLLADDPGAEVEPTTPSPDGRDPDEDPIGG
jgi:DNA-binding PadR family transcriptional regulator